MGRPKEHGEDTRAALLEAAERIVEAEGAAALSVRRLADEVGTTTRAVYSLFGSKEGLLVALGTHAFGILGDNLSRQRLSGDPVKDLAIAGFAMRALATEHPGLFRLAVQRQLPDPALAREFAEAANAALELLRARVRGVEQTHGLNGRTVDSATWAYHCLCEGLASVELRGRLIAQEGAEAVWRDSLAALVAGLSVAPGSKKRRASRAR